ncbi:MAG TPA: tetratricopeptide repeat protein [Vicinamibacterales bacterium]|nr:tetratricopeptide repeat protein [Vicinamibacterales bacterium]
MPIDRAATLRNAEKLLRQGKLEPAIAEYLRVVEDQPRDWNTANALGDLYVRAAQPDRAVEQFLRIADSLSDEGFLPKAAALYKKVIKLKPDHERALLQAASLAAAQGTLADARSYLATVEETRRARGDGEGAAQIRIQIGTLDPADYVGRARAAAARVEVGDVDGAIRDLKQIALELAGRGRHADAAEALQGAARLAPDAADLRRQIVDAYMAAEDFPRAREWSSTAPELKWLADGLDLRGRHDEAVEVRVEAARLDPGDHEIRTLLARAFVERGDLGRAAEYLTTETAGDDPQLLMIAADIRVRAGQVDEAVSIVRRLLSLDATRAAAVGELGCAVAETAPDAGFAIVGLVVETVVESRDWVAAAALLSDFAGHAPNHIPALMRLVEVCVDGGLESRMCAAQALLADAYLAAGMTSEARFIAEDLVAREPWERVNIDRFRRALVMMNEPDPDAIIADRLGGQSPFTSTDLNDLPSLEAGRAEIPDAPATRQTAHQTLDTSDTLQTPSQPPLPPGPPARSHAIDIESLLSELEPLPVSLPAVQAKSENVEVDLSIVLNDLKRPPAEVPVAPAPSPTERQAAPSDAPVPDLEEVFEQLRGEATRKSMVTAAEGEYRRALALHEAGDIDGCIAALEEASRTPKLRFATASMLGRIYKQKGSTEQAVEWLERAAQAPAPTPADYHEVLFELAEGLEVSGEVTRALDVCLELQADAGSYRDIDERVDRLAKTQARG